MVVVVVVVVYLRSGPTTRQKASESAAVMIARTRRAEKMSGPASWRRRLCRPRTRSVGRCKDGCCCCGSSCCMGVGVAAAIVAWQGRSIICVGAGQKVDLNSIPSESSDLDERCYHYTGRGYQFLRIWVETHIASVTISVTRRKCNIWMIVPRAQKKKTQVRLLPPAHSTQLVLLSPICTCSKRLKAGNAPYGDSTPQ